MTDGKRDVAEKLVEAIRIDPCSFYRNHWNTKERFETLPVVRREHFVATPLTGRTYREEKGLVKIVKNGPAPFLVQWGLSDLSKEIYGTACNRPMVLLSDPHEALEKALWFYERNTLPLIGESNNLPIAAFAAHKYGIDAIVSDEDILFPFVTFFGKECDVKGVQLTLIGSGFSVERLQVARNLFQNMRLVLALPETGAFAESCPGLLGKGEYAYHPDENSVIEIIGGRLVITKLPFLITPIIRYDTALEAETAVSTEACLCNKELFILKHT